MAPGARDLAPDISPGASLLQLRHRGQRVHTCDVKMSVNIEKNRTERENGYKCQCSHRSLCRDPWRTGDTCPRLRDSRPAWAREARGVRIPLPESVIMALTLHKLITIHGLLSF